MAMVQQDRCSRRGSFRGPPGLGAIREDFLEEVTSREMTFSWKVFQEEETVCVEAQRRERMWYCDGRVQSELLGS